VPLGSLIVGLLLFAFVGFMQLRPRQATS